MTCPACGVDRNRIIESRSSNEGKVDRRRHECACGIRWTSRAVLEPGTITNATDSVFKRRFNATDSVSRPPPTPICSVTPPTNSVGGVGGALSSAQGVISLSVSDPDSISFLLSNPDQTRAKSNGKAKNPRFTYCRDHFVTSWEDAYGEKYPFEVKDATGLAKMLSEHPEYGGPVLWESMVTRYLADEFWGRKRHPLVGLATRAREFAGPGGSGVPQKVQDGRTTAKRWMGRTG